MEVEKILLDSEIVIKQEEVLENPQEEHVIKIKPQIVLIKMEKDIDEIFVEESSEFQDELDNETDIEEEERNTINEEVIKGNKPKEEKMRWKRSGIPFKRILPDGHVWWCNKCGKTFPKLYAYRYHMHAHNNPMLITCSICKLEFSHTVHTDRHKKNFHPELFKKEQEQRHRERMEKKVKPIEYNYIPISEVKDRNPDEVRKILVQSKLIKKKKDKSKTSNDCFVAINPINLPGFYKNDWILLAKEEKDYPWLLERKPKNPEHQSSINEVVDTKNFEMQDDAMSDFSFGDDIADVSDEDSKPILKVELVETESKSVPQKKTNETKVEKITPNIELNIDELESVINKIDPHLCPKVKKLKKINEPPKTEKIENIAKIITLDRDVLSKLEVPKKRTKFYISNDEIPDVPKFVGAKYIYDVYNNDKSKRYKIRYRLKKLRNKLGVQKATKQRDPNQPNYYKKIIVECKICGESVTRSGIRPHVAKHCYEDTETICRICHEETNTNLNLRKHFGRQHKISFMQYLIEEKQKQKASGKVYPRLNVDYVECGVCLLNLKNQADLDFHTEMLHTYLEKREHILEEKMNKNTTCSHCGKKYSVKRDLLTHLIREHDEKIEVPVNFICHYCGKGCQNKAGLLLHFNFQHREKKIEGMKSQGGTVKLDEQSIVCETCEEIFKSTWPEWLKVKLMKHNYDVHGQLKPEYEKLLEIFNQNKCCLCNNEFRIKKNLMFHFDNAICNPNRPSWAKYKPGKKNLNNYNHANYQPKKREPIRSKLPEGHVYCCRICEFTFFDANKYQSHVHSHDDRTLTCCQICDIEYATYDSASRHKRKSHPGLVEEENAIREQNRKAGNIKPIDYWIIPLSEAKDRDPENPKNNKLIRIAKLKKTQNIMKNKKKNYRKFK